VWLQWRRKRWYIDLVLIPELHKAFLCLLVENVIIARKITLISNVILEPKLIEAEF
jgi:hypothetical protein